MERLPRHGSLDRDHLLRMGMPLALILALGWPGTAMAQGRIGDDRPTAGPAVPWAGPLSPPTALHVLSGPASLAHLESWELALSHVEMDDKGLRGGTGTALLFAQRLPWLPLTYGLGLSVVRWPSEFDEDYGLTVALTGVLAARLAWWASLGLAVTHFEAVDGALDSTTTADLSLLLTPSPLFGASVAVHDLFMPNWAHGLPLQRTWDLDVGFRPFGTRRLTLSVGVTVGERRATADPRVRIEAGLWRSLVLVAQASYRHRALDLDADGVNETLTNDLRTTLALSVDLEHWGAGGAVMLGRSDPALPGRVYQGAGAFVRYHHRPTESLWRPANRVLVVTVPPSGSEAGFARLVLALARAENDDRIAGVLFKIPGQGPSWSKADELRTAVERLRHKGKFVASVVRSPSNKAYYLAASTDAIWMDPSGTAMLSGLAARRLYFKKALDRIGVTVQVLRNGPYKTAPNSLTRTSPSKEEDEVIRSILREAYDRFRKAMSRRKSLARAGGPDKVLEACPAVPPKARKLGLVDEVYTSGQVEADLKRRLGDSIRFVRLSQTQHEHWGRRDSVAVIVIEGDLVAGRSGTIPLLGKRLAGHKTILAHLRKARKDPHIKAVVLRINSPGGLAVAADEIWRTVMDLRKAKPVVASIGNIAASGGYEIAAATQKIFCESGSLTGSVGMFIAKPVVLGLLGKLGIGLAQWKRGPHTGLMSSLVALDDKEQQNMRSRLLYHYRRFLKAVAKGRNMPLHQVEKAAGGRLWTCRQAMGKKLVDATGGLRAAVAEAKRRAHLPDDAPVLVWPKKRHTFVKWLLTRILSSQANSGRPAQEITGKLLSPILPLIQALPPSLLVAPGTSVQARLPYKLEIQ